MDGHVCTLDKVEGVNRLAVSTNGVVVLLARVSSGLYQIPSPCFYPAGAGSDYWLGSVEVTNSLLGFVSVGGKLVTNSVVGGLALEDLLHQRFGHVRSMFFL